MSYKRKRLSLILVFSFSLFVHFYKFDSIPGEWFGDISNVHEYVSQIIRGERPFYFFQSPGPLYHYLITPIVLLYSNHGFETYKMASIVISLIGLIGVFLFVAEISSIGLALLTTLTMSFSLWYLIWSRLGNSQIVIPALIAFMSLFVARFVKKNRLLDLFIAAFFASLGWYTYPQTFIFPAVFFLFIIAYLIFKKKFRSRIKSLVFTFILMIIMVIPFITIVQHDKGNFGPRGYVGEKVLPNLKLPIDQLMRKTLSNWQKVLFMLHVRGDRTFRVNVPQHPQLDKISGIFFLLGFLYFAKKKRRMWLFYILWMLLILPVPSISPAIPDAEIPNSARTIAVVPFVFLLVSAGFLWSFKVLHFFSKHLGWWQGNDLDSSEVKAFIKSIKLSVVILLAIVYAYIAHLNLKLYFVDYTNGLPDRNLAPGKIIANYIDQLPSDISLYFSSCCFGEWGEPEPKGVVYQMHNQKRFADFGKLVESCGEIKNRPAIVVNDPRKEDLMEKFMKCSTGSKGMDVVSTDGILVSKLVFVN